MPALPLRYRLPNPPAVFVGRSGEVDRLKETLKRAPVTVVWGLGGLGKTALVLATLHRSFKKRLQRALFVQLHPGGDLDEALIAAVRVLARVEGVAVDDPKALAADPELLVATAIDLADQGSWTLVLDNLQHAPQERAAAVLSDLARYARKSRWIATTRVEPLVPELGGQLVHVGAMRAADLLALGRQWSPDRGAADLERLAGAAAGSPWRLGQLLSGAADTEGDLLGGIDGDERAALTALACLEHALPLDALRGALALPSAARISALERRGLLERTSGGHRLHDVARPLLEGAADDRLRASLGAALVAHEDPVARAEGLGLLLAAGRTALAVETLQRVGEELLASGMAPILWRAIGGRDVIDRAQHAEGLQRWRLRIALEHGDPEVLASLEPPVDGAPPAERLSWARLRYAQRHFGEAEEAARQVAEAGGAPREIAAEAALLQARALICLGRLEDAMRTAEAADTQRSFERFERDEMRGSCLASVGRHDEALAMARDLEARIPSLPETRRSEALYDTARIHYILHRLPDARRLVDELLGQLGPHAHLVQHGRKALQVDAAIALEMGDLERVGRITEQLSSFLRPIPGAWAQVRSVDVARRFHAGELEGLEGVVEDLLASARETEVADVVYHADIFRTRLASLRAEPPIPEEASGVPSQAAPAQRLFAAFRELHRALARTRWEAGPDSGDADALPDYLELAVLTRLVRAQRALLLGRHRESVGEARAAYEAALEAGFGIAAIEALDRLLEAHAAAGEEDALREVAQQMVAKARAMPSPRFEAEGRFYLLIAAPEVPDPAALEALAALGETAPVAARRAATLLGDEVPLDAIDRLVVQTVLERYEGRWSMAMVPTPTAGPDLHWGLDGDRRVVWRRGAEPVSFEKKELLWRVLEALADQGGEAIKEDLAEAVWDDEAYHPLVHDNRMRLAVRKIRQLIEDEPGDPRRLITTAEGYALAGPLRRSGERAGATRGSD